ncbi:hypothetical protein D9M73_234050 [compost metagenome]
MQYLAFAPVHIECQAQMMLTLVFGRPYFITSNLLAQLLRTQGQGFASSHSLTTGLIEYVLYSLFESSQIVRSHRQLIKCTFHVHPFLR